MAINWLHPPHYQIYNKIVKRAARYVLSLDQFASVTEKIFTELNWLLATMKCKLVLGKFAYSIVHSLCPKTFLNCFDPLSCKQIITRNSIRYLPESTPKTKFGKNATHYRCHKNWLELEDEIKNIELWPIFCNKLNLQCIEVQANNFISNYTNICDYSCIEDAIISTTK